MRKILQSLLIIALALPHAMGQNLSFTCPQNITVSCGPACLTLNAKFPDLRSLSTDYTVSNVSSTHACFPPVAPGAPGNPTSITLDDTYSSAIALTFNFPFYGLNNSSVLVSTNGYLCFDLTRAGLFSHYGILNGGGFLSASTGTPQDVPSSLYDKSLIMGPYQDLDPSQNTSPTRQIKYDVIGTAPTRKWIVSFYKEPLFLTACNSLFLNTQQIILYESSGVIEVYVQDKQICNGWNNGLAMIGIQDDTRAKGMIAPGRGASSGQWGSVGMNETWRFIPVNGTPLYNSVQLLDGTGAVVATGDTSRVNANTFEWNFTNVCPPPNVTTLYVVKTTYQRIDNPAATFYSLDTINVLRTNNLTATTAMTPTTCGASAGSILVTPTSGISPYTFTLNGGGPVSAPGAYTFTGLAAGSYTIVVTDVNGCTNTYTVIVTTTSTISATATPTSTTCPLSTDGTITVTPTTGTAPYTFSLDGGPGQTSNVFNNVPAGSHTITFTDAGGCSGSVTVTVTAGNTPLTAGITSTPTACPAATNGTITVNPTSGTAPYLYSLDGGPFQPGNVFNNVTSGSHTISVKDNFGCNAVFTVVVGTNNNPLTATVVTTPTSCPSLNDGTITVTPTSGTSPYQYSLDGGPFQPGNIFTNVPSGAHTVTVKDFFGCSNSFPANVVQGASLTYTVTPVNPPCNNLNNGSITINPTSGTPPYTYSLNGGPGQASNIFSGLAPGAYTIIFTDNGGCTGTSTVTLTTNPAITTSFIPTKPLCNGNANGNIVLTSAGGVLPYQFSINGGTTWQASSTFSGLTAGTYNFLVKDAAGCVYPFSYTLGQPPALTVSAPNISSTCNGNDGSITVTAGGGTPPYQYSIDNGVTYLPTNVFIVANGNYNNIIVKDANNCTANTSTVVALLDTMRLELGPDSTICVGKSVTFAPQTNPQTNIFKWTASPTLLPTEIDKDTIPNATVTPPATKKYYLTAKWGVCQRIDSITIFVQKKPVAYAGPDTVICSKTPAYLNGSASNISGLVYYAWAPISPLITFITPDSSRAIVLPDSTQQYIFNVRDGYGCGFSVFDTMTVSIDPPVPAFAGNDTIAMLGRPHQLMATGGVSYLWSPSGPLNNPFIQNPLAKLYTDTYFRVTVTDAAGCSATDDIFLKVYAGPTYYVPNAFSPNGDGLNDVFRPIPSGIAYTDYFNVFNRYGELVFQTNQWLKGWDGKYKGKDALSGTYVWNVKGRDYNGNVVEMTGTVLLIR